MDSTAEQWKLGGDCTKCRREKYCKTTCKLHRRYIGIVAMHELLAIANNRLKEKNT